jgi:hypothetical protein
MSPADAYRDGFAAIAEALDVPLGVYADFREEQQLRSLRAIDAKWAARALAEPGLDTDEIRRVVERFRAAVAELPVTYRVYDPKPCGDGCVSPVDGVHDTCPGPRAGRPVGAR